MRKLLLSVHFYGGLACFWYLIILGVSSLNFNHHFPFMDGNKNETEWARTVSHITEDQENLKVSEDLRDSLGLVGWPLYWETWRDSTGIFHFVVEQPGKRYEIDYSFQDRTARVKETQKNFWRVFNALHGFGSVPRAPFMDLWSWYTRLTVLVVVFSVMSGVYLWYTSNRDRQGGNITLALSMLGALGFMIYMYLIG
jgi:hypothetical protein